MHAAASADSKQCAVPEATTPRKLRSVAGQGGGSVLYGRLLRNRCTFEGVFSRRIRRRSAGLKAASGGGPPSAVASGRWAVGGQWAVGSKGFMLVPATDH